MISKTLRGGGGAASKVFEEEPVFPLSCGSAITQDEYVRLFTNSSLFSKHQGNGGPHQSKTKSYNRYNIVRDDKSISVLGKIEVYPPPSQISRAADEMIKQPCVLQPTPSTITQPSGSAPVVHGNGEEYDARMFAKGFRCLHKGKAYFAQLTSDPVEFLGEHIISVHGYDFSSLVMKYIFELNQAEVSSFAVEWSTRERSDTEGFVHKVFQGEVDDIFTTEEVQKLGTVFLSAVQRTCRKALKHVVRAPKSSSPQLEDCQITHNDKATQTTRKTSVGSTPASMSMHLASSHVLTNQCPEHPAGQQHAVVIPRSLYNGGPSSTSDLRHQTKSIAIPKGQIELGHSSTPHPYWPSAAHPESRRVSSDGTAQDNVSFLASTESTQVQNLSNLTAYHPSCVAPNVISSTMPHSHNYFVQDMSGGYSYPMEPVYAQYTCQAVSHPKMIGTKPQHPLPFAPCPSPNKKHRHSSAPSMRLSILQPTSSHVTRNTAMTEEVLPYASTSTPPLTLPFSGQLLNSRLNGSLSIHPTARRANSYTFHRASAMGPIAGEYNSFQSMHPPMSLRGPIETDTARNQTAYSQQPLLSIDKDLNYNSKIPVISGNSSIHSSHNRTYDPNHRFHQLADTTPAVSFKKHYKSHKNMNRRNSSSTNEKSSQAQSINSLPYDTSKDDSEDSRFRNVRGNGRKSSANHIAEKLRKDSVMPEIHDQLNLSPIIAPSSAHAMSVQQNHCFLDQDASKASEISCDSPELRDNSSSALASSIQGTTSAHGCQNNGFHDADLVVEDYYIGVDRSDVTSLRIGPISKQINSNELKLAFLECGIEAGCFVSDIQGDDLTGWCFAEFKDTHDVRRGLSLNGTILNGCTLQVKVPMKYQTQNTANIPAFTRKEQVGPFGSDKLEAQRLESSACEILCLQTTASPAIKLQSIISDTDEKITIQNPVSTEPKTYTVVMPDSMNKTQDTILPSVCPEQPKASTDALDHPDISQDKRPKKDQTMVITQAIYSRPVLKESGNLTEGSAEQCGNTVTNSNDQVKTSVVRERSLSNSNDTPLIVSINNVEDTKDFVKLERGYENLFDACEMSPGHKEFSTLSSTERNTESSINEPKNARPASKTVTQKILMPRDIQGKIVTGPMINPEIAVVDIAARTAIDDGWRNPYAREKEGLKKQKQAAKKQKKMNKKRSSLLKTTSRDQKCGSHSEACDSVLSDTPEDYYTKQNESQDLEFATPEIAAVLNLTDGLNIHDDSRRAEMATIVTICNENNFLDQDLGLKVSTSEEHVDNSRADVKIAEEEISQELVVVASEKDLFPSSDKEVSKSKARKKKKRSKKMAGLPSPAPDEDIISWQTILKPQRLDETKKDIKFEQDSTVDDSVDLETSFSCDAFVDDARKRIREGIPGRGPYRPWDAELNASRLGTTSTGFPVANVLVALGDPQSCLPAQYRSMVPPNAHRAEFPHPIDSLLMPTLSNQRLRKEFDHAENYVHERKLSNGSAISDMVLPTGSTAPPNTEQPSPCRPTPQSVLPGFDSLKEILEIQKALRIEAEDQRSEASDIEWLGIRGGGADIHNPTFSISTSTGELSTSLAIENDRKLQEAKHALALEMEAEDIAKAASRQKLRRKTETAKMCGLDVANNTATPPSHALVQSPTETDHSKNHELANQDDISGQGRPRSRTLVKALTGIFSSNLRG